jgi:hypothetical protein
MIIDESMGVELPAGVWFPEPVREMTIFAEQYDFAVTLLLFENQYSYTRFDREPVKDGRSFHVADVNGPHRQPERTTLLTPACPPPAATRNSVRLG